MALLRIATRASRLALVQTHHVAEALRTRHPQLIVNIVEITTEGDRDRSTPLNILGGRGVFVKAVEDALLDGRADVAVHSLKDVPTENVPDLMIAAIPERADPRDVLVASEGRVLSALPPGAQIGTSSRRRTVLLRALRPDLVISDVRGNVETRLAKVHNGELDGVVLAAAGLARLDILSEVTQFFDEMEFLPAPGQGALGIQCRSDDQHTRALLVPLDDLNTRHAIDAERSLLAALGTGCLLPVGAYASVNEDLLTLRGMLAADDDTLPHFGDATGTVSEARTIGHRLGKRLQSGQTTVDYSS